LIAPEGAGRRLRPTWRGTLVVVLLFVALVEALTIWQSLPHDASIANSRLVLSVPRTWEAADARRAFDPVWAAEQKRKYPADGALIESLMDGLRSGELSFYAVIDVDRDRVTDGSVLISVTEDAGRPDTLQTEAAMSVLYQPVQVEEGTKTADVTLPTGPGVRLDWSYTLHHADGTSEIVAVRSYWLVDGTKTIVIQLTVHDGHVAAFADFESVIQGVRWSS
jgi:hypothetical protein